MDFSRIIIIVLISIPCLYGRDKVPTWLADVVAQDCPIYDQETDAVLLISETRLFSENNHIIEHFKAAYKIQKTSGLKYGSLLVHSRKGSRVKGVTGWRFDDRGALIETLRKENVKERAYHESYVDDATQVFARFQNVEVGDIVAFAYTHRHDLFFKDLMIPMGAPIDIQRMTVFLPDGCRARVLNDPQGVVTSAPGQYPVSQRPMIRSEPFDLPLSDRVPVLAVSFDAARMNSWSSFSQYYWSLTHEAMRLSPETKSALASIFAETDLLAFIEGALDHVTQSVNYVDVAFGRGAFIPRDADFVDDKRYGDCKDMAFYAAAILRERGLSAFPALSRVRRLGRVYQSFPGNQFNHVILAVALDSSTAALENARFDGVPYLIADLTDRFTPRSMIPSHLEGTCMLPVLAEGGELWQLPRSNPEQNRIMCDIDMTYGVDGTLKVRVKETRSGHHAAKEKAMLEHATQKEIHDIYHDWVQSLMPGSHITHIRVDTGSHHTVTHLRFSAQSVGLEIDDGILFVPNFIDRRKKSLKRRSRTSDLDYGFSSQHGLDVTVRFDPGIEIIETPESAEFDNDLLSYTYTCSREDQVVHIKRDVIWRASLIPQSRYREYRSAYRSFLKTVRSPIIVGVP